MHYQVDDFMNPRSRLVVLPGNSYHVAASHAERCAQETLAFIRQSGLGEGAAPAGSGAA